MTKGIDFVVRQSSSIKRSNDQTIKLNTRGPAAGTTQFNNPHAVAVDGAGSIYVGDFNNSWIRKIS